MRNFDNDEHTNAGSNTESPFLAPNPRSAANIATLPSSKLEIENSSGPHTKFLFFGLRDFHKIDRSIFGFADTNNALLSIIYQKSDL